MSAEQGNTPCAACGAKADTELEAYGTSFCPPCFALWSKSLPEHKPGRDAFFRALTKAWVEKRKARTA